MKKKNTMPERDWQQTHEKIRRRELRKRILVMGLTVAMVANTVDLSALSVSAKTDESEAGKTTIVSFEELSKDITEQTLPIGALESDIKFPTSLTVTVEKTTQADEKEADDEEDASETGDTEKDDAQKDDSNGDTASSDDKKDTESSDEKDGDSGNADASDKSGASDNGNADTKDSDTSKDSGNSDKSNNPNGSSSSDTEDTQARADLPSAFGALIGQMADALLPHKLIVYAAEKDDASDTAATSDGADNAKKTDTASTSDNADSVKTTGSADAAASSDTETTTEKIRLKNIKWELNVEESDAEEFDSSEASNGFCYAYTPVLPDEDGDGNQLVLGKDVELPTIYVLVGEYGIALLADGTIEVTETDADGTEKAPYTAQDLATWIGGHGSASLEKVSIKLLNDDASITSALTIGTGLAKEIELDLNGHTLTLQGDNARLYFKRANITITSSGSNQGTITGSYDCKNKFQGDGLVTADNGSMLTIKCVTIENAGTGSTVAMWGGVTCTIDKASISGSSGEQVGTITIDKGKACTITNTKVTGNVRSGYGTIMFTDSCSDCTIGEGAVIENKNSGGRCVYFGSDVISASVKITIKKGAALTANDGSGTIMDTSYGKVAVGIEGGTFNGRLCLPDNSQIAGGTFASASKNAIWVNNSKKTLQDLLKVGYTLKYDDGTYADLTARWTDEGRKVTAVKSPLYFATHPTISSGAEIVMENYTAAEAPELTVKAESGSGTISYQWYVDETINGTTTTKVEQTKADAKSATYRIPTGLSAGTYQYYCVATCGKDTATSKKAVFTVEEGVAEVTVGGNTTRYATLTKAIAAMKDAVDAADADLEITLKILKDIFETGSEWKIDEGTKKVSFCMDLNGCTVTGKGLYITGEGVEAVFKDTSAGQNGTLNAPVSIQNKAKLTVENGNYKGVLRFVDGATAKLKDGYYSSSIYIGKTERMDNTDISCTITGGTYVGTEVLVCGGATLSVSGDTAKIKALHIDHREFSQIKRAKVMLSGGEYGEIALSNSGEVDDESLLNEMLGYAIADTLEEGYAFYSAGIKTDISRTDRSQGSVEVLRADTLEDTSQAVVKFQIEKNSGETKTMYFLTWDAAMFYLEGSEEHRKNKEYKLWEKLEILLLKDTTADKSINRMLNKVYLPAEITLRSEGNKPHTLKRSNENYLFITGGQDVIIENINVVGNIDFLGDTRGTQAQDAAVLRLGERATGLGNIEVTGNSEIVIEKGVEIPKTFTGGGGNLNASIYCNHDSADFSSKITQGAGAFKIWFPIELGGIALPTGGENDTNVTQRDGATYGLYSNGGATGQKIKVTGEVCSYEPYGGNAEIIDTTDLSFTMPSSKVTLKAHTKDDYGYCSNCRRTDLAEAYKKGYLHIEGLEGRTYDGYPQVMTGITLMTAKGDVKLTGPEYNSGKELAQDSSNSANADITNANYTVVYKNNIKCNENEESTDAPTAIITGRGDYYGTVEVKFAIKKGEMQVTGATAAATEYDGKAHTALADSDAINVTLKADEYDANAHIPVTDGYIAPCTGKTLAKDGFNSEHADKFPLKISCKLADGKGYDNANEYTVTNAGSYPFTIMVMAENNSCPSIVIQLTAKITPRDLSALSIPSTPLSGCAYYTGKPYSFDDLDWKAANLKKLLTDSGITGADGGGYVLVKDTDFTVTEEDTTGPATGAKPAKLNLTGKGNYTGNAEIRFEIPYAFTLAQTPVSGTDKWYRADVPVSFAIDDKNDAAQILYRKSKAAASDSCLNGSVEIYEGLEAAVAGENPGYTFTQEGKNTVTLYGKDTAKGCLSEPVEVTICIDKSAPTWTDKDGVADGYGIQIKENWFRSLLNTISFGYLYNDATLDIKIQANDKKADVAEVSGISRYYYYVEKVSDTALASVKTKDELDALAADGKFREAAAGTGTILPSSDGATISGSLSSEGNYVVYAYAVDGAGNQSDYICTDGIVVDAQAPVVKIADPKKEDGTLKDTEAILKVNLSEDATLMWFFVSEGVFDGVTGYTYDDCKNDIESYMKGEPKYPQFAVENDGKWAPRNGWYFKPDENLYCGQWEVRTEGLKDSNANQNFIASWTPTIFKTTGTKGDNKIEIGNFGKFPLYPSKKTAVWIAAIDKAGNITALTEPAIEFTTAKTTPYVKTAPVLSGTYGNTVSAMFEKADMTKAVVTAGLNSDTKVEGTWTLAAEDADKLPTVGTSEKYSLVFTPTGSDADTYDSVTCEVTPEVSKKQITVVIADKEKFYGETNPALTWSLASGDAYPDNVLVADDTEEALVISLSTTAKDNSDVGTYAITGSSDSANYEVSFTGSGSDGKSGILTVKHAANSFTTELSCSDYTYAKDKTPEPSAKAKFGTVTYKYATAASDGTAPTADSAYADAIPVNAGSYAVKAYVAETDNYAGLTSDPVVFTINKAASPNIGDEEKSYSYAAGSDGKAISVDIAGKLPTDRGTTTYAVAKTDTEQFLSEVTVDTAGNLTYKVNQVDSSKVGKTAIITVTASMENYANAGYTLTISITDKKTVEIKRGNSVSVDGSNVLTYGEKVSKLTLVNTVFVEAGTDDVIEGILSWSNPDAIPAAGTTQAGWVFKPTDSDHYEELTGTAAITVARATPAVVTAPAVAEREYNPAVALVDSDMTGGSVTGADGNSLAGTWSFTGTNIIPTVNNKGYQAVFTPDDTNNYNTVTRTITVKVTKATPVITQKPTAGALTYGQELSDSTLTGGKAAYQTADGTEITGAFAWKNSGIKPTAADSQKTEYDVTFTPSDKDNYNAVDTKLTLTVNKAAQAPNMPQTAMAPAHSTNKVGDITLPEGWSWQEADRDTVLADGVAVTATAVYTGADKGNYETESVIITITRSICDHTHTEIRNQQEATCKKEGYTGDTYCKDCGEKLATGTATVKKAHTVGTPATCVSKAVCSVCSETFGEVDATNHVHTTVKNRKEATCTQTGYTGDTYCTDCNKLLSTGKELAALGHDYKATVTKQPTTTEEGVRTYTCTRCNSSYTESIAKLPKEKHTHNYTGSITKEATCTEAGVRTYTCSCGDSYTENIPATGHSYVSKVTKAATTTEEGIMTYTCSKCGHSYTQPIAKIKSDDSSRDNGSQNQKPQSGTDNGNQNQNPQPDTDNGKEKGDSIKPYIKDDSGKEGWDVIKPQLEEAKAGDTVTVAMNGTTVVPKDVIDSIKGKDTTLVLDMGNGLSWKIYGKDITDAAGDIDFDVTVGADAGKSIPVDVINNVTGEHSSLNLTLAYDGEFGFTATLTVNMESKNAGLYANLFYYNEQTGELEFISAGQIDPDGNVELVFTHASDYTIVVDAKIMSDNGQADNKSDETIPAPKTDDSTSKYAWNNTIIIIIGICIILIVFGAVFYVRKKSGSEEE